MPKIVFSTDHCDKKGMLLFVPEEATKAKKDRVKTKIDKIKWNNKIYSTPKEGK